MWFKLCKAVHRVDLDESFQTHIYLQNLASIQPRTSPLKFARSSGAVMSVVVTCRSQLQSRRGNANGALGSGWEVLQKAPLKLPAERSPLHAERSTALALVLAALCCKAGKGRSLFRKLYSSLRMRTPIHDLRIPKSDDEQVLKYYFGGLVLGCI